MKWIEIKKNKVRGKILNEMDDDRMKSLIELGDFEERLKIGNGGKIKNGESEVEGMRRFKRKRLKSKEKV
jgi:hypothetical protein